MGVHPVPRQFTPMIDMGAYPVIRRFTHQEYQRLERASPSKNEYVGGLIYAMAGGTANHDDVTVNVLTLIKNQIRAGKCKVRSSGFRIAVSGDGPSFYPDLSVFCGKVQYLDATLDCALNPVALIEVTSKSTRKFDRETKLVNYRQMASVRHIALISQFSVSVEHHIRGVDGKWSVQTLEDRQAMLELSAVGVSLPLAQIYEGVSLRAQS